MRTRRSTWEILQLPGAEAPAASMTIVVSDETNFSYAVGEVEISQSFLTGRASRAEQEARREEVAAMRMIRTSNRCGELCLSELEVSRTLA